MTTLWRVDSTTAEMRPFVTIPGSANERNPFGVLGLFYACDNDTLYAGTAIGSTPSTEHGGVMAVHIPDRTTRSVLSDIDVMGVLVVRQGDSLVLYAANVWLRQGLNQALTDACGFHQWFGLLGLAQVAGRRGHHIEAATWYGAAERLAEAGFDRSGFAGFSRRDIADVEAARLATRAALGEEAFAVAFAAGKALSLEQAGAEVLAAPQS